MKTILFLVVLTFWSVASAHQETSFRHDALCKADPGSFQSEISRIEKISVDEYRTTFRMVLTYARCDDFDILKYPIKLQKRMLQITNYGFNYPGKKTFAKVESYKLLSEEELEAEISIEHDSITDGARRRFVFRFWAQDWVGFPWTLSFEKNAGEIELKLKGFEPL